MKKLIEKLKKLFAKLFAKWFGKDEQPAPEPAQPAVEPPATGGLEPRPESGESLLQAAQRRGLSVSLWAPLTLFAASDRAPAGLTVDEIIDLFLATNDLPPAPENPTAAPPPGRGSIPVGSLSADDRCYIRDKVGAYLSIKQNGDLWRDVCSGSATEIANAIQAADIDRGRDPGPPSEAVFNAVLAAFSA